MVHVEGIDDRMIANNLEPHYLTHPGEVIKDELEARGISQRQLAKSIGVPASQLNELLNAKRSLSAEMALLIGQALDIAPAPLLALQTDYNLLSAKRNKSFLERLKDIPKIAAVFWHDSRLLHFIRADSDIGTDNNLSVLHCKSQMWRGWTRVKLVHILEYVIDY